MLYIMDLHTPVKSGCDSSRAPCRNASVWYVSLDPARVLVVAVIVDGCVREVLFNDLAMVVKLTRCPADNRKHRSMSE